MIYQNAADWLGSARKRVLIFGMSGLGKTYLSNMLRDTGEWFHYSADYRIGTRYMGEHIADNAKAEAMKVPFLRELLLSDSITITSKITFNNLTPVAAYLGKPGALEKGGLEYGEYCHRQDQFRQAEIRALQDTEYFIERAERLYDYPHFICDTGGSICEWVDPEDPGDPLLSALAAQTLMVWIKGTDTHTEALIQRFDKAPKPMAYQPAFLKKVWQEYLIENNVKADEVNPDTFIRWTYGRALAHRQPLYATMARNWGITIDASDVAQVRDSEDFSALIAKALTRGPR